MVCINVNEVQVEGIKGIRDSVYNDFQSQFKLVKTAQPDLAQFGKEDVKHVLWNRDSFKILGLDGYHLGFLKEFWVDMKENFMRFLN